MTSFNLGDPFQEQRTTGLAQPAILIYLPFFDIPTGCPHALPSQPEPSGTSFKIFQEPLLTLPILRNSAELKLFEPCWLLGIDAAEMQRL